MSRLSSENTSAESVNRSENRYISTRSATREDAKGNLTRRTRNMKTYNINEMLLRLQEAPALRTVLLDKMDEEYRTYRMTIERTLNAVADIVQTALVEMEDQIEELRDEIESLRSSDLTNSRVAVENGREIGRRIRWGQDESEIRDTVMRELVRLHEDEVPITTESIKKYVPGMLRWLYGENALYDGIQGLRQDFYKRLRENDANTMAG